MQNAQFRFCPDESHRLESYTRIATHNCSVLFPCAVLFHGLALLVLSLHNFLQPCDGFLFVRILAAFFRTNHRQTGWLIDCTHTAFDLVHVLTAFAATAESFECHSLRVKLLRPRNTALR